MKYIYGIKNVLKGLKEGKIEKVIYSKDTPKEILEKIKKFGVKTEKFNGSNIELGAKIKRSHSVLVLGVENENKVEH